MSQSLTRGDLDQALNEHTLSVLRHFDKRFDEIKQDILELDKKYDWLVKTLDKFLKRLDDIEKNDLARDAQLARYERWLHQIAEATGVELKY